MLHKLNLDDILFLDIETVPLHQQYSELSAEAQMLWEEKTRYQRKEEFSAEEFYDRAGIWAEFGKIVCISVGYFSFRHQQRTFRVTSFTGEEKSLLEDFGRLVNEHFSRPNKLYLPPYDYQRDRNSAKTTTLWQKALGNSSSRYDGNVEVRRL